MELAGGGRTRLAQPARITTSKWRIIGSCIEIEASAILVISTGHVNNKLIASIHSSQLHLQYRLPVHFVSTYSPYFLNCLAQPGSPSSLTHTSYSFCFLEFGNCSVSCFVLSAAGVSDTLG
jgi:hypothetical protein